tara:strand:- start:183 stop:398 length:216 start_codon:yes stop_codon:yes gene_type:complete
MITKLIQNVRSNVIIKNKLLFGIKTALINADVRNVQKLYDKNDIFSFDLDVVIVTATHEKDAIIKNKIPEL